MVGCLLDTCSYCDCLLCCFCTLLVYLVNNTVLLFIVWRWGLNCKPTTNKIQFKLTHWMVKGSFRSRGFHPKGLHPRGIVPTEHGSHGSLIPWGFHPRGIDPMDHWFHGSLTPRGFHPRGIDPTDHWYLDFFILGALIPGSIYPADHWSLGGFIPLRFIPGVWIWMLNMETNKSDQLRSLL